MGEPVSAGWQAWLLPPRPGLRQFLLGAIALLLPVPAVALGVQWMIPAMVVAVTLGVGLGIGWAILYARTWLAHAPLSAAAVFAVTFGCLLHLALMPRWEVLMRVLRAADEADLYLARRASGQTSTTPPSYQTGIRQMPLRLAAEGGAPAALYTPEPLQRWTPMGFRDSCWLVVRADGTREIVTSAAELQALLGR